MLYGQMFFHIGNFGSDRYRLSIFRRTRTDVIFSRPRYYIARVNVNFIICSVSPDHCNCEVSEALPGPVVAIPDSYYSRRITDETPPRHNNFRARFQFFIIDVFTVTITNSHRRLDVLVGLGSL